MRRYYVVYEEASADGKRVRPHVASTVIESIQELLEGKFTQEEKPITRYLVREHKGGADDGPNSLAWRSYVLDPNEEAKGYDTFEEATAAI